MDNIPTNFHSVGYDPTAVETLYIQDQITQSNILWGGM